MKKFIRVIAAAGALVLGLSTAALAQGYGGTDGNATSTPVVSPNTQLQLRFTGFLPLSQVRLTLYSDPVFLGEFTADQRGEVVVSITVPANTPVGDHHVVASGTDVNGQPLQSSMPVKVEGANLALTGTNTANTLALAGLLIVVGMAGMAAARRRLEPAAAVLDQLGA